VTVDVPITSGWLYGLQGEVCVRSTAVTQLTSPHPGITALGTEVANPTRVDVCFVRNGESTGVVVDVIRDGQATSALAPMLPGEHRFELFAQGQLPAAIWDGSRLDLPGLVAPTLLESPFSGLSIYRGAALVADIALGGEVTLRFSR
jgi:hypothetical protein